jgi:TonB family protein
MTFSDTVAQQREKQAKALKQFVMVSLAGSVVLHSGGLFLKISDLWTPNEPVSEDITIVVTPKDEPETAIAPDVPLSEPIATPEFSSAPVEPFSEPTVADAPVAPTVPLEPTTEETVAEEIVPDATAAPEDISDQPSEAIAPSESNPRNLRDLLAELRQARQQGNPSTAGIPGQAIPGGNPAAENTGVAGNGRTTAAAPTRPGSGITPPESNTPERGRRSREIACRGCDFDYPESANGAEGTAQVVVETDEQGRVVSVMLSRSSGNAALDRAALEQARRRVRLSNARAGESYPIDIDFVQPNSEAAQRVRERGDRRSITVSDPEPETANTPVTPAAPAATNPSPGSAPSPSVEPSVTPTPESSPPSAANLEQPNSNPEPVAEPDLPSVPTSSPQPANPQAPATPPDAAPESPPAEP